MGSTLVRMTGTNGPLIQHRALDEVGSRRLEVAMGAWGEGSFQNDCACDWVYALTESDELELLEAAFSDALAVDKDLLEADDACMALAAAEVVAVMLGRLGGEGSSTDEVAAWVAARPGRPPTRLVAMAQRAVRRVVTEPSELLELWDEGGRNEAWHASVDSLSRRLAAT